MNQLDAVQGCLAAPVALTEVCATSVNRCSPSAGLGLACAFAPDGGVFVTVLSDNLAPNAKGWRFALSVVSYPTPFPQDEIATSAEYDECSRAACTKPCPGVEPLHYWSCPDAGGDAPDAGSDATAD